MKRTKALVAGISAGALALTLAACGGSSDDNTGNSGFTDTNSGGGQNPDAKGPAPEIPGAKAGGDVTVLAPDPDDGPASLDPTGLWSVTDNGIAQDLLFRSLTTFRQDEDGNYELVPDLATDLGTPNDDYTEWKFTLKDGIKWETGDPVTAKEVEFGIERSFDADTFATGPGTSYSIPYFEGGDKYKGPYVDKGDFPGIDVSGNTLTFHFSTPFPEFNYYAIFPAIGPVPLDADAADYGLKPLSTGPYKIQKFTPNQELVLVKNDQWDPNTDPARRQLVNSYTFKFDTDPKVAADTVFSDAGNTTVVTALQGKDYTVAKNEGHTDNVLVGPQPCTSFVMPNYQKVKELQVRQALAYAYPYEDVWSAGGELPGVTRANGVTDPDLGFGLLPPGMAGRKVWNGPFDDEPIKYDPEKAKSLLKEAGYDPGEYEVSFVYDASTPEGEAAAQQRKLGYEKSGFSVKMYPYTGGSLYDVWTDPDNKLYKKINLLGTAWCQDWPSASTFLPVILGSNDKGEPTSAYNTGFFSEQSVNDEIARIKTLPLDQQADAWGELEQKAMTDYQPVINTGYYNNVFGFGSNIAGLADDTSVGGAPDYRTIYVK